MVRAYGSQPVSPSFPFRAGQFRSAFAERGLPTCFVLPHTQAGETETRRPWTQTQKALLDSFHVVALEFVDRVLLSVHFLHVGPGQFDRLVFVLRLDDESALCGLFLAVESVGCCHEFSPPHEGG